MELLSKRAELIRTACVAHLIGLIVVSLFGTMGTSGGFGNGASAVLLVAGILSVPWFATLLAVIWIFPDFYWKHYVAMAVVGPGMVCGSWWLLGGSDLIDGIAFTAIVDSIAFLAMISFVRWRTAIAR